MLLAAELYLKENIDDHIEIKRWSKTNIFPVFLRNIYRFYSMTLLDTTCIIAEIIDETSGIDAIKKHIMRIEEVTSLQVVLYYKDITRYRRKSLIENRIAFVIEDGQMFLPFIGLNLKKAPEYVEKKLIKFSTSTQLAYLYFLYNNDTILNTIEFSKCLGFNVMTASRALNDLHDAQLVTYKIGGKTGRSKIYTKITNSEYIEKGMQFIKSPIKKIVYVKSAPEKTVVAGLEALSELSMINPPGYSVRAISKHALEQLNLDVIKNRDIVRDEKLVELQIWDYEPNLFSNKGYVDPMSLYASLKDEYDERVEEALEELLRGEKWLRD